MKKKMILGLLVICIVVAAVCAVACKKEEQPRQQYDKDELTQLAVSKRYAFDFAADMQGWNLGKATDADAAERVVSPKTGLMSVKLGGNGTVEGVTMPSAWMYNKILVNQNSFLSFRAVTSDLQPVSLRVRALEVTNDAITPNNVAATTHDAPEGEDAYYKFDSNSGSFVCYDLRQYQGKEIVLSFEVVGSTADSALYISDVKLTRSVGDASTFDGWRANTMLADWEVAGNVTYTENCLHFGKAMIYNRLRITDAHPFIAFDVDGMGTVAATIDGKAVIPAKSTTDVATVGGATTVYFDLRDYMDTIIDMAVSFEGDVKLSAARYDTVCMLPSILSEWDKLALAADWEIGSSVQIHSEGICLHKTSSVVPQISNIVRVPAAAKYLKISVRMFVRDGEIEPKLRVYFNDKIAVAYGTTENYVALRRSDVYQDFYYDVSEMTGETISVIIDSFAGQHAAIGGVAFVDTLSINIDDINEVYTFADIEKAPLTSARCFAFDNDVELYGWQLGTGRLQYDLAEWIGEGRNGKPCIRLDGSDLGTNDGKPNAWLYAKFMLTAADRYLTINLQSAEDNDGNVRVRLLLLNDNGTVEIVTLNSADFGTDSDKDGYYTVNGDMPEYITFDISAYAGRTAVISIEQDDSGEGAGELIQVYGVTLSETMSTSENE